MSIYSDWVNQRLAQGSISVYSSTAECFPATGEVMEWKRQFNWLNKLVECEYCRRLNQLKVEVCAGCGAPLHEREVRGE